MGMPQVTINNPDIHISILVSLELLYESLLYWTKLQFYCESTKGSCLSLELTNLIKPFIDQRLVLEEF